METSKRRNVYMFIRSDDYGMTKKTCDRIIDCIEHGSVNSVSILPNGCLSYGAERLSNHNVNLSIHLNFVEGKSLNFKGKPGLLMDGNGNMKNSFLGLLLLSLSPKKKQLYREIYQETRYQIAAIKSAFPDNTIWGLDSHQHVHMIPLIYGAIMAAAESAGLHPSYIRIPAEPILPYLREPSLYFTYSPINFLKQIVLKFLNLFIQRDRNKYAIESPLFCGVLLSGRMDRKRLKKLAPHFLKEAERQGKDLEFIFHPGYIERGEEVMDPQKISFNHFYYSKGRKIEFMTLHQWKGKEK